MFHRTPARMPVGALRSKKKERGKTKKKKKNRHAHQIACPISVEIKIYKIGRGGAGLLKRAWINGQKQRWAMLKLPYTGKVVDAILVAESPVPVASRDDRAGKNAPDPEGRQKANPAKPKDAK